jgi:hypothetical protein
VAKSKGEQLRDQGIEQAASPPDRRVLILSGQVRLLDAAISAFPNPVTIEDSDADMNATFADGGKWRGAITMGLVQAEVIEQVGFARSRRPSRHCGPVGLWRIRDIGKARMHRRRRATHLAAITSADNGKKE